MAEEIAVEYGRISKIQELDLASDNTA